LLEFALAFEVPGARLLLVAASGVAPFDETALLARSIGCARRGLQRHSAEFFTREPTVAIEIAGIEAGARPVPFVARDDAVVIDVDAREEFRRRVGADHFGARDDA